MAGLPNVARLGETSHPSDLHGHAVRMNMFIQTGIPAVITASGAAA